MFKQLLFLVGLVGLFALASCQSVASAPVTETASADQVDIQAAAAINQEANATPTASSDLPTAATLTAEPAVGGVDAAPVVEPTPTPTEASTSEDTAQPAQPIVTQDPNCEDQVVFIKDVNVPDGTFYDPGAKFTKVWQVKNSGTCTWNGYNLVFEQGDVMSAPLTDPFPAAAPGEVIDISLELTAPQRTGLQTGNWIFQTPQENALGSACPQRGWCGCKSRSTASRQRSLEIKRLQILTRHRLLPATPAEKGRR